MGRNMMIDIHTHILPKADDGARDWDTCFKMLVQSAESGVKAIIATPHYSPWMKGPEPKEVFESCKEAHERLKSEFGIEMQIYPGNEIYYSVDVIQEIKKGKALTLAGSSYVLVEFAEHTSLQTIYRAVREFRDGGYIPILAHIERCRCLYGERELRYLKEGGALFQINAEMLDKGIFSAKGRWVKRCLKKGWIDFVASDMHNLDTRPPIRARHIQWMQHNLNPEYYKALLYENAEEILSNI